MGQSTISIERIDDIIMEGTSPTISRDAFRMMIADELNHKLEQIWRVRFYEDGTVGLYSFALPTTTEKNLGVQDRLNDLSQLPEWVRERISVLQICESGTTIDGVGQKVSERVFYVIE
jgi:hypothetical protein